TAYRRFKSEFNAYWVDGSFDSVNDTWQKVNETVTTRHGAIDMASKNPRAHEIKKHLVESDVYDYIAQLCTTSDEFLDLFNDLNQPWSANLENDPAVDDVIRAIMRAAADANLEKAMQHLEDLTEDQDAFIYYSHEVKGIIRNQFSLKRPERVPLLGLLDDVLTTEEVLVATRLNRAIMFGRSEERRVGKEVRSRGGSDQ